MTTRSGPIFEVAVLAPSVHADALASALTELIEQYRHDAGTSDSHLLREGSTDEDSAFIVQLSFDSNESLDEFLSGRSSALEQEIDDIAPGSVLQNTRILREDLTQNLPGPSDCLNCRTPLRGQYCGQCGQRAQSRLISLWELIRDAFGDMFELDSRLWQTLVPLMVRPGRLTADYLQGKRARFMPPFRMYLVLSLLFFLVAFFNPSEDFAIFYEDPAYTGSVEEQDDDGSGSNDEAPEQEQAQEDDGRDVVVSFNDEDIDETDCEMDQSDVEDLPVWIQRRLTPERLSHICKQMQADDGDALLEALLDNIPAALIVLLPLMALALQILYPLSRRYYVEHLLFIVHYHSFFFLALILQILWGRLIDAIGLNEAIAVLPIIAVSFYIPVYLFKSMRRVYQQGFFLTLLKFLILTVVYTAGFGLTMFGAFAIAAFSI